MSANGRGVRMRRPYVLTCGSSYLTFVAQVWNANWRYALKPRSNHSVRRVLELV